MTLARLSQKCLILGACCVLSACSSLNFWDSTESDEPVLEGERLSLYDFEKSLQQDPNTRFGLDGTEEFQKITTLPETLRGGIDRNLSLEPEWTNKFWPQAGGYPNHAMKHVAFSAAQPEKLWSSSIGSGSSTRLPLMAAPIVADGRAFTLNNDAEVMAFDLQTGQELWTQEVMKRGEDEVVLGGGIAFSGDHVFVTAGFNEILALAPDTGEILWRAATKSPIRAAPSAIPGRVFVTTLDNQTLAFNADNGTPLWSHRGLDSEAGILGAATPALTRDAVYTTYSSGEIYALQIDTGLELWVQNLSPLARVAGRTIMSDIRALPVFDDGIVYATSLSNRMNAIDARTGQPIWQASIGSVTTPWVSGNRIFMVETGGTLISLDRESGDVLWQYPLPRFEDEEDREDPITWQGPVLAGGRLIVFGSHGEAQAHNPTSGDRIETWDVDGDIKLPVAIAEQTLYTIDDDGRLSAWR